MGKWALPVKAGPGPAVASAEPPGPVTVLQQDGKKLATVGGRMGTTQNAPQEPLTTPSTMFSDRNG
jgi:hypothetical protein